MDDFFDWLAGRESAKAAPRWRPPPPSPSSDYWVAARGLSAGGHDRVGLNRAGPFYAREGFEMRFDDVKSAASFLRHIANAEALCPRREHAGDLVAAGESTFRRRDHYWVVGRRLLKPVETGELALAGIATNHLYYCPREGFSANGELRFYDRRSAENFRAFASAKRRLRRLRGQRGGLVVRKMSRADDDKRPPPRQ